jgi:hypothetical protein
MNTEHYSAPSQMGILEQTQRNTQELLAKVASLEEERERIVEEGMTPDQFFDALDELFGNDDGYIPHLDRIKTLKADNEELKTSLQTTTSYHADKYELLLDENEELLTQRKQSWKHMESEIKGLVKLSDDQEEEIEALKKTISQLKDPHAIVATSEEESEDDEVSQNSE